MDFVIKLCLPDRVHFFFAKIYLFFYIVFVV